ncbi:MFS transporter [Actinocrispum wychmicini]|uniref:Putative MFS family arabinose efflux permease n=1 Tax=Actinocrispum wychmicini TaxID=1213861 RepID=A0A4R2ITT4_9PSEU|nr:MFS transporter [Actinocrispum wychmicini]TCO48923.1 putative MFS family arabinose efflux permease [Actinocrispum wychmicini]
MNRVGDRATYLGVLANPTFRVLFMTRSLAITADALRIVALSVLVLTLTGSTLLGAMTYGISFIPQLLGAGLFGAIADRLPARRLIALGYAAEFGTGLLLALVDLPVWLSLTVVAAVSAVTPVFNGAASRVVADVLTGDGYVLSRSLMNLASSAAQLLGLAGGGVAIAALGGRHAMLVSAFVHLAVAIWVRLGLPPLPAARSPEPESTGTFRQSWTGNRRLMADRTTRNLILAQWLPSAFVTGAESLLVPYAAVRGQPVETGGLLLACLPVGMMIGSLAVGRFVRPVARERLLVPLLVVLGLPLLGFVIDLPVVLCGTLLVVTGSGFAYGLALQRRFLAAVPEDSRGLAFSLLTTGMMTAQGISPALAGALAGVVPIGGVIALAGVATLAAAVAFRRITA